MATKWKPLDEKAILWWCQKEQATIEPPMAWPYVTFRKTDGTVEKKSIGNLVREFKRAREDEKKANKKKDE